MTESESVGVGPLPRSPNFLLWHVADYSLRGPIATAPTIRTGAGTPGRNRTTPFQGGNPIRSALDVFGLTVVGLCIANAAVLPAAAFSPSERITLVSQSSPGTGNDLMLRKIAEIWTENKMVDQLVGNENVTGAIGENGRLHQDYQLRPEAKEVEALYPGAKE